MSTTIFTFSKLYRLLFIIALVLFSGLAYAQTNPIDQDSTRTGFSLGRLSIPNPQSIVSKYTYDPITARYIYSETAGKFNINYPILLTPPQFQRLVLLQQQQKYYKQKIDAAAEHKEG
mgnify:CR=1 FL=1